MRRRTFLASLVAGLAGVFGLSRLAGGATLGAVPTPKQTPFPVDDLRRLSQRCHVAGCRWTEDVYGPRGHQRRIELSGTALVPIDRSDEVRDLVYAVIRAALRGTRVENVWFHAEPSPGCAWKWSAAGEGVKVS